MGAGGIARLKQLVSVYPPLLKQKTVSSMLWMAEFSLLHADGYAASGDIYAALGAMTRTAAFLTQALFALNETYFMSDKTAIREMVAFPLMPEGYLERLSAILGQAGRTAIELQTSVDGLRALWRNVVDLTAGAYRPSFKV